MTYRDVTTQAELDAALKEVGVMPVCRGTGTFQVSGSSQVTAYGSSQVTAYDSSQVRASGSSQVTAYDSSQVTACGSSQVTACDSSQVTAYDSSQVTASGSSQVRASRGVAVTVHGTNVKRRGGVLIRVPKIRTAAEWCEWYGVAVKRGVAVLFKGVDANYDSPHKANYAPGTVPAAADWDGGKAECGGGLHFSPTPAHTFWFVTDAVKFVACPVRLKDIIVHKDAEYPQKVKAPRCCAPVWECDINGKPVAPATKAEKAVKR